MQTEPNREALSKGKKEAGNCQEQDLLGEEALATGMAAIIDWIENQVENIKDKDPAQRHGKTETRNGPGCQVCFLIFICPMSGVQIIWVSDLQYNKSIESAHHCALHHLIFRSMLPTGQTKHPCHALNI